MRDDTDPFATEEDLWAPQLDDNFGDFQVSSNDLKFFDDDWTDATEPTVATSESDSVFSPSNSIRSRDRVNLGRSSSVRGLGVPSSQNLDVHISSSQSRSSRNLMGSVSNHDGPFFGSTPKTGRPPARGLGRSTSMVIGRTLSSRHVLDEPLEPAEPKDRMPAGRRSKSTRNLMSPGASESRSKSHESPRHASRGEGHGQKRAARSHHGLNSPEAAEGSNNSGIRNQSRRGGLGGRRASLRNGLVAEEKPLQRRSSTRRITVHADPTRPEPDRRGLGRSRSYRLDGQRRPSSRQLVGRSAERSSRPEDAERPQMSRGSKPSSSRNLGRPRRHGSEAHRRRSAASKALGIEAEDLDNSDYFNVEAGDL